MGPRRRKPFRLRSRLVSVHQDLAGALYDLDIFTLFDSSYYTKQSSVPFLVLFFFDFEIYFPKTNQFKHKNRLPAI
jgi:hypothetical protein